MEKEKRLSTERLSMPRVLTCLITEHLLGQLGHGQCTILLRTTGSQWRKASHEEVQTWEWHKVHCNLAQVAVQLSWEAQAAGHTTHSGRHQVVQVTVCWCGQLQSAEADIVQCFVVKQEGLIRVLHQLMKAQDCLGQIMSNHSFFQKPSMIKQIIWCLHKLRTKVPSTWFFGTYLLNL